MNETLKTISQRKSCRCFQDHMISEGELNAILDAAIQAPSAMDKQLCEAFAITNKELIDSLAQAITNVYIERGDEKDSDYHCAYHAPILIIVCGPEYDSQRMADGSCMLENIFLAATSLNIGSCWINQLKDTQDIDEVRNILTNIGIPTNYQVVGCSAIGYINEEVLPKSKKQTRKHIIR